MRSAEWATNARKALTIAVRELAFCDTCGRRPDRITGPVLEESVASVSFTARCAHGRVRPGDDGWYRAARIDSLTVAEEEVHELGDWSHLLVFFRRGFSVYPRDHKPRKKERRLPLFEQRRRRVIMRMSK